MRSILFKVFGLPIYSYGVTLVIGFALAIWRALRVCKKRYGIEPDRIYDLALIVLFGGVLGARVVYIMLDPETQWSRFFIFWDGGLSFHGGLVFALLLGWLYTWRVKMSFWDAADMAMPSVALAYACTRIGCFLNGCCYGAPTSLPWAVEFATTTEPVHPAQIYASLANLVIFFILVRLERMNRVRGFVFASYVGLYGVYRFLIEFLRIGHTAEEWAFGLTHAQAVSVVMIAASAVATHILYRKPAKT